MPRSRYVFRLPGAAIFAISLFPLALAPHVSSQELTVDLDPAATTIDFTLAATMHTVHGAFKLKRGQIRFDPSTGRASGSIVVDASSADTANSSRDKKMHGEILESARFPEIAFTPTGVKGSLAEQGTSQVAVSGAFRLHGQDHDATLMVSSQRGSNGAINAFASFLVPYVEWGLKNPSTFLLHVSGTVNVEVRASGKISRAP